MRRYRVRKRTASNTISSKTSGMTASNLVMVPIHVQLLNLSAPTNVAQSNLPEPSARREVLKQGIHLHWTLPDYFMKCQKDDKGLVEYPSMPNRWLIRKVDQNVPGCKDEYLVESDYLHRVGTIPENTSVISFDTEDLDGIRYIGRSRPYSVALKSTKQDDYLENLTANSFDSPEFATFYPKCQSVFGFYDASELNTFSQPDTKVFYDVLGWFADRKNDPVSALVNTLEQPDCLDVKNQIEQRFGWQLDEKTNIIPHGMVCFGRVFLGQNDEADT